MKRLTVVVLVFSMFLLNVPQAYAHGTSTKTWPCEFTISHWVMDWDGGTARAYSLNEFEDPACWWVDSRRMLYKSNSGSWFVAYDGDTWYGYDQVLRLGQDIDWSEHYAKQYPNGTIGGYYF